MFINVAIVIILLDYVSLHLFVIFIARMHFTQQSKSYIKPNYSTEIASWKSSEVISNLDVNVHTIVVTTLKRIVVALKVLNVSITQVNVNIRDNYPIDIIGGKRSGAVHVTINAVIIIYTEPTCYFLLKFR